MNISKLSLNHESNNNIKKLLLNILLVLSGSFILAISSKISIHFPFSPVPITAQTFVVLLLGFMYKKEIAAATVIAYIIEGISGLPVFANPGSGIAYILSPTFGYLIGFVLAAYTLGFLNENKFFDKNLKLINLKSNKLKNKVILISKLVLSLIVANIIIYIPGIFWLSRFVGIQQSLLLGFYPFIIGDILKISFLLLFLLSIKNFVKD